MRRIKVPSPYVDKVGIREVARGTTLDHLARARNNGLLSGRVLDYGCGPQPYRGLVVGEYFAYDPSSDPGFAYRPMPDGLFDAVICTYVIGYTFDPAEILVGCRDKLREGGYLVGAYAMAWSEIEPSYVCAPTFSGMCDAFGRVPALKVIEHERACSLVVGDFEVMLSGTFVARRVG